MIGFVVTPETASFIKEAIRDAQTSRGKDTYWLLEGTEITSGEHVGKMFLICDDAILTAPLSEGKHPTDFPEFPQLIGMLGGLGARVDLPENFFQ